MWAQHCKESLRHILETLQQLITLRVISTNYTRSFLVQDDESVTLATKLMKVRPLLEDFAPINRHCLEQCFIYEIFTVILT